MALRARRTCRDFRSASLPLIVVALMLVAEPTLALEPIVVTLDQARLMKLPDRVSTIVVGNPMIADVSVQAGGMLVITGKGYGTTNLVVLDRAGNPLLDRLVEVQGPRDQIMVVFRGVDRETYSCTPMCERRITIGDTQKYFDSILTQSGTISTQATGPGGGGGGPQSQSQGR